MSMFLQPGSERSMTAAEVENFEAVLRGQNRSACSVCEMIPAGEGLVTGGYALHSPQDGFTVCDSCYEADWRKLTELFTARILDAVKRFGVESHVVAYHPEFIGCEICCVEDREIPGEFDRGPQLCWDGKGSYSIGMFCGQCLSRTDGDFRAEIFLTFQNALEYLRGLAEST